MDRQTLWKASTALFLFLAATGVARADEADNFIRAQMKRQNIPGLSLAVIKDGEIIKAEGYGLANIKLKTPAKPETVYRICSVSKQFIATGIMLLVQEGHLGLDDSIGKYLEGTPSTWNAITIRQLLTHTSGLVREAPGFNPFKVQSDAEVIRTAYPLPLSFAPGEKWEYSNVGYFALAEIIDPDTLLPVPNPAFQTLIDPLGTLPGGPYDYAYVSKKASYPGKIDVGDSLDSLNGIIATGNGKDTIDGAGGNDVIVGGNGKDVLNGGEGNDIVMGRNGKDEIVGGPGLDVLTGGNGPDMLDARDGAAGDVLDGGNGPDECLADAGDTSTNCP